MNQELKFEVRKGSTMEYFAILMTLAIICAVGFVINLFIKKSPAAFLDPWFIAGTIIFTSIAIWYYVSQKHELIITIQNDGSKSIRILKKKAIVLEINKPTNIKSVFVKVPVGGRQKMNELKLVISEGDEKEATLMLSYSLGKIYSIPNGFHEVPLGSVGAKNNFTCSKIESIHKLFKN